MYLLFLTMKTVNGAIALGILVYSIILAIICPILRKKEKRILMLVLCVLPMMVALAHLRVYDFIKIDVFAWLYAESLLPLINLLPGRSGKAVAVKSAAASVSGLAVCFYFLVCMIGSPMIHNYTRYTYTESFKKMLDTLEKEYVLSSWKQIDYDALLEEYLPRVEEAEKNNDEGEYAAIISEVTYRFYDAHVGVGLDYETDVAYDVLHAQEGNDYGMSMIRLDDGSVIAICVEPDSEAERQGIHEGTVVLSWDGAEIAEAVENTECIYYGMQFPVKDNEDVFRPIFLAKKGGESVEVTFLDDEGEERSASLQRLFLGNYRFMGPYMKLLDQFDQEYRNYYACMLDDKCGYLQIRSAHYKELSDYMSAVRKGYYPELTEFYAELIGDLQEQGMEYLVIDLRNNGGGYDSCGGALASLFTEEKTHMVSFGYEDEEGYHIKESQYIFPDGRFKDIPVVVLVNAACMSAGDGTAKFLGDCPNVTLMGFTSSSGVNQNNGGYIYLTESIMVYYPCFLSLSADGEPLIDTDYTRENRIPLDVTIPMTKETALRLFSLESDEDVELGYAMEYLQNAHG